MRPLAVISGGGTGIGGAIARGLSADGFDLVLVGLREAPLAETASKVEGATIVVADLRDPGSAGALLEAVGDREVGAIVNNAGGYLGRSRLGARSGRPTWTAGDHGERDLARIRCRH